MCYNLCHMHASYFLLDSCVAIEDISASVLEEMDHLAEQSEAHDGDDCPHAEPDAVHLGGQARVVDYRELFEEEPNKEPELENAAQVPDRCSSDEQQLGDREQVPALLRSGWKRGGGNGA